MLFADNVCSISHQHNLPQIGHTMLCFPRRDIDASFSCIIIYMFHVKHASYFSRVFNILPLFYKGANSRLSDLI